MYINTTIYLEISLKSINPATICEIHGQVISAHTSYSECRQFRLGDLLSWQGFCGFPQTLQANAAIVPQIKLLPLPSTSISIYYSLIIRPFVSKLLTSCCHSAIFQDTRVHPLTETKICSYALGFTACDLAAVTDVLEVEFMLSEGRVILQCISNTRK
jgi:hypothetical protein